jgi:hypothetical protein
MALPAFNMRQLLEAGCHFGHQSHRWNPKMAPFIFGARNNIHIIDLAQTVPLLHQALVKVSDIVAGGGRVLFVGTKRQASEGIADAAKRSAQYFINHRWLGGTLTNWKTISQSIRRLRQLDETLAGEAKGRRKRRSCSSRAIATRSTSRSAASRRWAAAGPAVRDRHQQGADRHRRSQEARHSHRRHRRHQLQSGRHRLPGAGQRRCGTRDHALLRPDRPRRHRRHRARPSPGRRPMSGRARRRQVEELPVEAEKPAFKGIDAPRGEADD